MIRYHLIGLAWVIVATLCALDSYYILAALSLYASYSHAKEGIES